MFPTSKGIYIPFIANPRDSEKLPYINVARNGRFILPTKIEKYFYEL